MPVGVQRIQANGDLQETCTFHPSAARPVYIGKASEDPRATWFETQAFLAIAFRKDVRAAANLRPGDRIHFTVLEDGTIIVRVKNKSIRDISFRPPGAKRVSIAKMNR
jgi:hypothetical protein